LLHGSSRQSAAIRNLYIEVSTWFALALTCCSIWWISSFRKLSLSFFVLNWALLPCFEYKLLTFLLVSTKLGSEQESCHAYFAFTSCSLLCSSSNLGKTASSSFCLALISFSMSLSCLVTRSCSVESNYHYHYLCF